MNGARAKAIHETAVRLFREKGFHATSVQDIADAVGLQKGSLYHYITSKEELLGRIVAEGMLGYAHGLEQILSRPGTARERLERAVRHHVALIAENTAIYAVFLREWPALEPGLRQRVGDSLRRYQSLFERTIEEGIRRGEFRPANPRLTAMAILGAGNWLCHWFAPGGRLAHEDVAASFVDLFLGGLDAGEVAGGSARKTKPSP
ncbi:MAG TPA: TetR/AcrR family transcriptional regulator [Clostridiales bacterium]|nr:TetR/AcrR family transcriptional regulator [Clostridiales bacterium]